MSTKKKLVIDIYKFGKIETIEQINTVGKYVLDLATNELEWYRKSIRPKRVASYSIRLLSLLSVGIATIIPIIGAVINKFKVDAIWITLAIALSGGLLAMDKYLGISSGWLRYIKTFMLIEMRTRSFSLEWQKNISIVDDGEITQEEITSMLDLAINYLNEIQLYIKEETNAWMQEFSSTIKEVEELVKQKKQEMEQK